MVEIFSINKQYIRLIKFGSISFCAMAIFSLVMPYLPDPRHSHRNLFLIQAAGAVGVVFFGYLAWWYYRIARDQNNLSLQVDLDGIWRTFVGKESGLIPWKEISSVKLLGFPQRLALRNAESKTVLEIPYQVVGFPRLCTLITDNASFKLPQLPLVLKPPIKQIIPFALLMLFQVGMGFMLYASNGRLIGILMFVFAAFFGVIIVLALTYKVTLEQGQIIIRKSAFKYSEIESVKVDELKVADHMGLNVKVTLSTLPTKKIITLSSSDISPFELQRLLLKLKAKS